MTGIIYKYTSPSGKSYIGQTIDPERRMEQHRKMKGDDAFHRAIKKYGFDNFTYEVLVTVDLDNEQELKQKLDFFERFYIRKYHTYGKGYNMTLGGDGSLGRVTSEETRHKISEANKGKHNHQLGRKHSDEEKQKMSLAQRGKVISEDTKKKMSEAKINYVPWNKGLKGVQLAWNKGKSPSDESRRKMSEAAKLRWERIRKQKSV